MGRTKGSKNKTKVKSAEVMKDAVDKIPAIVEAPAVPKWAETGVTEGWIAQPNMGKTAKPDPVCACTDPKAMHYGGPKGWCNRNGCGCQEFKSKE